MDIEKIAQAIESDAGTALPDTRQALTEASEGVGSVSQLQLSAAVEARQKLGMSQTQFAKLMGVSVRTLQDWEQGRHAPSGAAKTLLRIAAMNPEAVLAAA